MVQGVTRRHAVRVEETRGRGWRVWSMSSFKVILEGVGGGERVQEIGDTRRNVTDRGAVVYSMTMKISIKFVDTGSAGGLE